MRIPRLMKIWETPSDKSTLRYCGAEFYRTGCVVNHIRYLSGWCFAVYDSRDGRLLLTYDLTGSDFFITFTAAECFLSIQPLHNLFFFRRILHYSAQRLLTVNPAAITKPFSFRCDISRSGDDMKLHLPSWRCYLIYQTTIAMRDAFNSGMLYRMCMIHSVPKDPISHRTSHSSLSAVPVFLITLSRILSRQSKTSRVQP